MFFGAALALMTLVVSGALVLLTTYQHEESRALRASVASVRGAREAEIGLLRHEQAVDGVARSVAEVYVRRSLELARAHMTTEEQHLTYSAAAEAMEAYFTASRDESPPLARAAAAANAERRLGMLVSSILTVADRASDRAATTDRIADEVGLASVVVMLSTIGLLVFWTRRAVVRPIAELAVAITRFNSGQRGRRAPEYGAREVHDTAVRFNEMALLVERQRDALLSAIAGIAHDLRNPLNALAVAVGGLDPSKPLPSEERTRRVLAVVERQITRLNRMVGDLVDAARIEAGRLEFHLERIDLRTVVRSASDLWRDASASNELVLDLPDRPVFVRCDPARVEQALNNLVSNAIKFSPRGGRIDVGLHVVSENRARISVADQGVGIEAKELERVWEPFRRGAATAAWVPGVGLGLSSVKRIIEAQGGQVGVTSEVSSGSTFTFHLPVDIEPSAQCRIS